MKSLSQLCKPRESVFDRQRRDTVLDLTDFAEGRIDPDEFFAENWLTEGMKTLLEHGFRRLEGKSSQGVYKLAQAMGGGKTHNLLTLGLLAKHPEYRQRVMGSIYRTDPELGEVQVVAFSGRESDAPLGIWGAIAEQMGMKELFKELYSPLQAPGQKAWERLLEGNTVLILLDELAPYFESARSKAIGDSNLAKVTATALSNLLVAIGKESCSRVCIVISELVGAYQSGEQQISEILSDLQSETYRLAMTLEPVRLNTDELYDILRTRLFEKLPSDSEVDQVAQGYANAIRDAKQMDITSESPEQFAARIQSSYPFHPAIRDLYARFRENPGYQQTRGLIRIMRIVASRIWESGSVDKKFLISAYDLDFNDQETLAEIDQINNSLNNAIAHDLADEGKSVAEVMDANLDGTDTQDASKLLLISSLANVPNAVLGLSIPELIAYMAAPGRDLARLKGDVLEKLSTSAWYLHSTRDGKLFFKNVENLNAKLEGLVKTYIPEHAIKELRERLQDIFLPINKWCYQIVMPLPAIDEIELDHEKITLVITEPYTGSGLRPEIYEFYNQSTWKNRVAFLTGTIDTYEELLNCGKRLKAIQYIQEELRGENLLDNDPQMIQANDISDTIHQNFHSAVRETFTQLWYPLDMGLMSADVRMKFEGNKYQGEHQIIELLTEKMKFTEDVQGEVFRKKCEDRLFTSQSLPWIEVKRRAASNPKWQWHHPGALDSLKMECVLKDIWREQGGYVDKGPFPQPDTDVLFQEISRDKDTGEVTLKVTPVHGDIVYYDIGAEATTASKKVEGGVIKIRELKASFLTVDTTGLHETGSAKEWRNRITLMYRIYQSGDEKKMELQAVPEGEIRYTTDGSSPRDVGAKYQEPFKIPDEAPMVLAFAHSDEIESEIERIDIDWDQIGKVQVDPQEPIVWMRTHGYNSTKETYEFLESMKKFHVVASGLTLTITGEMGNKDWIELRMSQNKQASPESLEECLGVLRELQTSGQVQIQAEKLYFESGQDLLDWIEEARTELQPGEVSQ